MKVVRRAPLLNECRVEDCIGEVFGEDSDDIVDTCRRRGSDRLESVLMRGFADLSCKSDIIAAQLCGVEVECGEGDGVCQVDHIGQRRGEGPQFSREEVADGDSLTLGLAGEFSDDTGPGRAKVENRVAVWRVEATAGSPGAFTASRVETAGLVPVANQRDFDTGNRREQPWVEQRHSGGHAFRYRQQKVDHLLVPALCDELQRFLVSKVGVR